MIKNIYKEVCKVNIKARKEKDKSMTNITNDIKVKLENLAKVNKTKESDVFETMKKLKGEYIQSLEAWVKVDNIDRTIECNRAIEFICELLPQEPTEVEISEKVDEVIKALRVNEMENKNKFMGIIIKDVKMSFNGMADGKTISKIVREKIK